MNTISVTFKAHTTASSGPIHVGTWRLPTVPGPDERINIHGKGYRVISRDWTLDELGQLACCVLLYETA